MNISIIIPSYNTQETISTTLEHLSQQSTTQKYEIIVVDCSDHTQVEEITKNFPAALYFHEDKRFNPGAGRNIGARHASGELLMFIDSDVELGAESVEEAWKYFKQGAKIFGGSLEINTKTHSGTSAYLEHYFFNHESQPLRPLCERSNLSSALMCIEKTLFLSEGGFKDIPRMQDTEFTERLITKGHKLYFQPKLVALQTQDSPFAKVMKKIYINGQNLYYIRYKPNITLTKKFIFLACLPIISTLKLLRIIARHLRYRNWTDRLRTLALIPALSLGAGVWMLGFYNAILTEKGISKDR